MTGCTEHYEILLAEYYSWMVGSFEPEVAEQTALFQSLGIPASAGAQALDLGCGPLVIRPSRSRNLDIA